MFFIVIFRYDFCIVNLDLFCVWGFMFVSVFFTLYHYMLFYGTYVGKVVGKATREGGCCMTNVGIRGNFIFRETLSKSTCKSISYISLS